MVSVEMFGRRSIRAVLWVAVILACLADAPEVQAYIGPGAGFAFVGSFFVVLATFFLAFLKLLLLGGAAAFCWEALRLGLLRTLLYTASRSSRACPSASPATARPRCHSAFLLADLSWSVCSLSICTWDP